jgi:hypothetical protein
VRSSAALHRKVALQLLLSSAGRRMHMQPRRGTLDCREATCLWPWSAAWECICTGDEQQLAK